MLQPLRNLRIAAAIIIAAVIATGARASTQLTAVIIKGEGSGSTYHIVLRGSRTETANPGVPSLGPVFIPSLVTHTGASLAVSCVTYHTVVPPSQSLYQAEVSWAEAMWARLSVYPRCDTNPISHLDLLALWIQVVNDRLPRPSIAAHPSFGIVNVPLQLLTSTTPTATTTLSTNDGLLVIHAWSWSSWQFNHAPPPGVPPTGNAALTWYRPEQSGLLEASLIEHWSADYRVGGLTGSLPNLDVGANTISLPVVALTTELRNVQ
ncbi:hypothetical protein [Ferrimicrobium sp.]|uniref:hypothetical protein n=1 Tax=Ferrimicrobium sp. TaxID=2926050 RepID=UPI002639925B|nr:hypothetical protein [Ferrimicrobium sp.]